jgi:hypothetical protein
MSWGKRTIEGVGYDLTHLDSRVIDVTPKAPRSPTYRVLVSYGCHCFARDLRSGDPVSHHVADDGGRTRCFCVDRAAYSVHLPRIVRAASAGQAYFSQDHNMLLVERLPGVVAPYAIFFNIRKSRQKGVDVNLFVASAYEKPNLPTHLWHPPDLVWMPSKYLWRLGHNTARPDILAANEAQPVEALLVGEVDVVRTLVHSAPRPCPQAARPATITYNR